LYCYINNKCAESELTQAINEKVLSINMGWFMKNVWGFYEINWDLGDTFV
jgi:hypothetical protein